MAVDEKRFEVGGREYVARFDFNSICALEERTGTPFLKFVSPLLSGIKEEDRDNPEKVAEAASRIRFVDLRAVFHESLLAVQPDTTLADAGAIIGDGGVELAMDVVGWAVVKAMPQKAKVGAPAGGKNPPKT